ncbi:unnamed protein product [Effrenium voratum]|nr:unnamed protein product [Effrenium voratum]
MLHEGLSNFGESRQRLGDSLEPGAITWKLGQIRPAHGIFQGRRTPRPASRHVSARGGKGRPGVGRGVRIGMEGLELPRGRSPRERDRADQSLRFAPSPTGDVVEESPGGVLAELPDFRRRAFTEVHAPGLRQRVAERISSELPREPREGPSVMKTVTSQIRGFYLVKFAVSVTACYLTIQLLVTFAEVLLPFIFAVLVMIVLEPLKKFVMRVLCRLAVRLFLLLRLDFCVDGQKMSDMRHPSVDMMEGQPEYGSIPEDSPAEDVSTSRVVMPIPAVKRLLVALSIFYCLALSGRVLWLTARVFFRAADVIAADMAYYRHGAERLKKWVQTYISDLHIEAINYQEVLDDLVAEVEHIGTVVTQSVVYIMIQGVVTFIFLIYMLWSPIKVDGSAMATEVFNSTSRYLKVKCVISAFTGLSIGLLLYGLGLDLPAAFGLMSFLANFLPGIGSPAASVLPCLLAIIDVRRTPTQVAIAFFMQIIVHFFIDFVIEPVIFGISVEIHSVIVILGIWFFYEVWGVPGMLLSVPLLSVVRTGKLRWRRQFGCPSLWRLSGPAPVPPSTEVSPCPSTASTWRGLIV